jgi:SNF2 family DNA or RNA helicase
MLKILFIKNENILILNNIIIYNMLLYYSLNINNNNINNILLYLDDNHRLYLAEILKGCIKNNDVYQYYKDKQLYCPNFDLSKFNIYLINNNDILALIVEIKNVELITPEILKNNEFMTTLDRDFKIRNMLLDTNLYNYKWNKFTEQLESKRFYNININNLDVDKLKTKLYDYQIDNINWMLDIEKNGIETYLTSDRLFFLNDNRIYNYTKNNFNILDKKKIYGGLIMDDAGVGKTLQLITLTLTDNLKNLIIVPDHLYNHWIDQYNIHTNININNNNINNICILKFSVINTFKFEKYDRIIIDEIHEMYNLDIFNTILNLDIKYRWAISATPIISDYSLSLLLKYISNTNFHYNYTHRYNIYDDLWLKIIRRNTIKNIIDIINLPKLDIINHFVEFTEEENIIYQTEKITNNRLALREICCNLVMNINNINNNPLINFNTITIEEFKKNVILKYYNEYQLQVNKLEEINIAINNIQEKLEEFKLQDNLDHYLHLKQSQEEVVIKYKNKYEFIKDKIENKQNCPICMDTVSDVKIITQCGHIFCYECAKNWFDKNIKCPYCRSNIDKSKNYIINKSTDTIKSSKIQKLIEIINSIPDEKFIIYTQFDKIRESLNNININENLNERLLILSSNINTSGLDYSYINNLIIFEPFDRTKEIEKQLIGRIYRINQKKDVKVHRLIIKNSIEEELYL